MKTLLIMRHAKSSWKEAKLPDHDRLLNKRGKHDAPRMGRFLREMGLVPDVILSSTAQRARRTAEIVAEECGFEGDIQLDHELYAFDAGTYLDALAQVSDKCNLLLLVGHNPGLEELLENLTGEVQSLPTAAVAQVNLAISSWTDLSEETEARLVNLWSPKAL